MTERKSPRLFPLFLPRRILFIGLVPVISFSSMFRRYICRQLVSRPFQLSEGRSLTFFSGTSLGERGVRFGNWNEELRRGLANFARSHPDATVMLFSAWDTFSRILSDPARYGFSPADTTAQGGSIWFDFMHPTSRVHSILAGEIAQFLTSQPPQA